MKRMLFRMIMTLILLTMMIAPGIFQATVVMAADTDFHVSTSFPEQINVGTPGQGRTSNNVYAVFNDGGSAEYARFFTWSLGPEIPSGSVITGIEIQLEGRKNAGTGSRQYEITLCRDGVNYDSNTLITDFAWSDTTDDFVSVGGDGQLWGWSAVTPVNLHDTNFRVQVEITNTAGVATELWLDCITAKVYFTPYSADCSNVQTQLAMILDGGGQFTSSDFSVMKNGLADAVGGFYREQLSPSSDSGSWDTASEAYSNNDIYATDDPSESHEFGYAFDIPTGATVTGIMVMVEDAARLAGAGLSGKIDVELSWDGGTSWTETGCTTGLLPNIFQTRADAILGGPDDDWDHSWTPEEVNSGFRARVTAPDTNTVEVEFDWLPVTVYYTDTPCVPHDGTVELTVVQFGARDNLGAAVEITPVVLTSENYAGVADDIGNIVQRGGNRALSCGIYLAADTLSGSSCSSVEDRQIINLVTHLEPNDCCASTSLVPTACGYGNPARASALAARNYSLSLGIDEINAEFVGTPADVVAEWLRTDIVYPEQADGNGYFAPPFESGPGWVRVVADPQTYADTLCEKFGLLDCTAPEADFSVDHQTVPVNTDVNFTDNSTNGPTSWNWTFGDGGISTEQDPTHQYASAGTYEVTLSVANYCGGDSITMEITVFEFASIGDFVWEDLNQNGVQDGGEPGMPGVAVNLYESDDTLAGSDTTDANGIYDFSAVEPGDYYVKFNLPPGYALSPQDLGGDDAFDSDADTTSGKTIVTTLNSGESELTWDAGIYQVPTYTLTVSISPPGSGSVSKSPDQAEYPEGTPVTLTANAAFGWDFSGWSSSDITIADPSASPLTFNMPAEDVAVTATFAQRTPPPFVGPVGGEVYPVNKVGLVAPWIALTVVVLFGAVGIIASRRLKSR